MSNDVRWYHRGLALILGIFPAAFIYLSIVYEGPPDLQNLTVRLFLVLCIVYAILGGSFSLAKSTGGWRWGVWVSGPLLLLWAFLLFIFIIEGLPDFLNNFDNTLQYMRTFLFFAGLVTSACAAAKGTEWIQSERQVTVPD